MGRNEDEKDEKKGQEHKKESKKHGEKKGKNLLGRLFSHKEKHTHDPATVPSLAEQKAADPQENSDEMLESGEHLPSPDRALTSRSPRMEEGPHDDVLLEDSKSEHKKKAKHKNDHPHDQTSRSSLLRRPKQKSESELREHKVKLVETVAPKPSTSYEVSFLLVLHKNDLEELARMEADLKNRDIAENVKYAALTKIAVVSTLLKTSFIDEMKASELTQVRQLYADLKRQAAEAIEVKLRQKERRDSSLDRVADDLSKAPSFALKPAPIQKPQLEDQAGSEASEEEEKVVNKPSAEEPKKDNDETILVVAEESKPASTPASQIFKPKMKSVWAACFSCCDSKKADDESKPLLLQDDPSIQNRA